MAVGGRQLPPLSAGQVLLRVGAANVIPSDTYVRLGPGGPYAGLPHLLPPLPYTPGKAAAGVVEAVGPGGSQRFSTGDRVYCTNTATGSYAAQAVCDEAALHPLPDRISFAQGATVGICAATAEYALRFRAGFGSGQRLLIHGASGAVGLAAVQLAKRIGGEGALVVGSAGTAVGEAAVRAAGADATVNHRADGYVDQLRADYPGGFDVVLEMFGHVNLPADLSLLARRGRVCIIGSRYQEVLVNPRHIMAQEGEVKGVFLYEAEPSELEAVHKSLGEALAEGSLRPVVASEFPLSEAAAAHREVMQPAAGGASGSIVLVP